MSTKKKPWYLKKRWWLIGILMIIYIATFLYHQFKPLPEGISYVGETHMVSEDQIDFIYDLTYQKDGQEHYDHSIFDEIYRVIEESEDFLIIDMFMINDFSSEDRNYPKLSQTFYEKIRTQKEENPDLRVILITDIINQSYGSHEAKFIDPLKEIGVEVIYTSLDRLQDPNPVYSTAYRMFFQWFGYESNGWLPSGFGTEAPDMSIRSYLKLLNVKANHRKAVISENEAIVTSANPHDASGFHSNIAFRVEGEILHDLIEAERAVADFSGGDLSQFPTRVEIEKAIDPTNETEPTIQVQYVTENKVEDTAIKALQATEEGDSVWMGMFYLADRHVIEAIIEAAARGVEFRLVLDPNQNAFGQQKIGMPNIPVSEELIRRAADQINIKWYNVNKEQYHTKLIYVKRQDVSNIIGGSTNFTSRNLDDYNLENNLSIVAPNSSELVSEMDDYFDRIWNNRDGQYTVDYQEYEDSLTPLRYLGYLLQKYTRFTTY